MVSGLVVMADWMFTTPTVFVQPLTGVLLARWAGWPLDTPWLFWSIVLYAIAGACWLPVVWIQIEPWRMAAESLRHGEPLLACYRRFACRWELLGYPAFLAMLTICFLMVLKPS